MNRGRYSADDDETHATGSEDPQKPLESTTLLPCRLAGALQFFREALHFLQPEQPFRRGEPEILAKKRAVHVAF